MKKIRTHYDNLKVARNAPPEVIRAAYRSLSQKYHPDKNPNNPEAKKISIIINAAYEVLSDDKKRKEHDKWIAQQENNNTNYIKPDNKFNTKPKSKHKKSFYVKTINTLGSILLHFLNFWILYLIGIFIVYAMFFGEEKTQYNSKPYLKDPKEIVSTYKKSDFAPNGEVWPKSSGYIKGYSILNTNGLSNVKIDNSRNESDVFVKLVSLDGINAYPVRQFYIKKHGEFTLKNITSGRYDIRYRDLGSGHLSRSEYFNLYEIKTIDGTQFSDITITLYKVYDGNMKTYNLSEKDF